MGEKTIHDEVSAAYDQLTKQRAPGSPPIQAADLRVAVRNPEGRGAAAKDTARGIDGTTLTGQMNRSQRSMDAGLAVRNDGGGMMDEMRARMMAGESSVMDDYRDLPVFTGDKRLPTAEQMRPQHAEMTRRMMMTPEQMAALIEQTR